MSPTRRFPPRAASTSSVRDEREHLRALLLEKRPELAGRLVEGPSGALVIPLAGGGSVEIGRMRRRGAPRWVVVSPAGDGARVREPATLRSVARETLNALDAAHAAETAKAGGPRGGGGRLSAVR